MAVQQLEDIVSPGADVLGTTQDGNGTILAQTGDVLAEDVASDGAEWWQHVGFMSRPAKANAGKDACQCVTINRGSCDLVVGTRDLRASSILPQLGEGETCIYAPGPSNQGTGKVLLQDDGSTRTITITVGTTQIVVKSDDSITIKGSAVNIAGASDFAALASKVDENFQTIASAFAAVTPGPMEPGLAGLKSALSPTPPSVAASEVKIS